MVTTRTIRCAKLQSNHHHQQTNTQLFTGWMPFLSPNQQCQSTGGKTQIKQTMQQKCTNTKLSAVLSSNFLHTVTMLCVHHTSTETVDQFSELTKFQLTTSFKRQKPKRSSLERYRSHSKSVIVGDDNNCWELLLDAVANQFSLYTHTHTHSHRHCNDTETLKHTVCVAWCCNSLNSVLTPSLLHNGLVWCVGFNGTFSTNRLYHATGV